MDIKMMIIQRVIDMSGNIIADQISKPDWEARHSNIESYYKNLQPIVDTLPDAPSVRGENGKVNEIVAEVCTPDLSPKELFECQECVREVVNGSNTDIMQKYFKSSATG